MKESAARRTAAIWVLLVFVIGTALGAVLGYMWARHSVSANVQMTEQERRARRLEQITKELQLTPDQRQHLEAILTQIHTEYKGIRETSEAQMEQARQKGRSQIRMILTPEQKPKFEDFARRLDEERKRNLALNGGRPPR